MGEFVLELHLQIVTTTANALQDHIATAHALLLTVLAQVHASAKSMSRNFE